MSDIKYDDVRLEAIRRFAIAIDAESDNRELAVDDINFRNGHQWEEGIRQQRALENRPTLTINKLESRIDQVTGDQRMNRMGVLIRPLDSSNSNTEKVQGGNFSLAEVYTGIIKNIEAVSNAKSAYDTAFDHAVGHGFGYWRITTEYNDDDTFDQDIKIKRISNSMRVYLDPSAEEITKKDANWGFVTSMVDEDEYPDSDWERGRGEGRELWFDSEKVRIAEYFRRVEVNIIIWLLSDGRVVRVKDDKIDIRDEMREKFGEPQKERKAVTHKVEWYKLSANEVFDKTDFPSKFIPIIPCYGKELNVDGRTIYRGVIRYAKDPQRIYNYTRTSSVEQVSLAPKAPWVIEENQVGAHKSLWETSNTKNHAMLVYKHKNGVPMPQRQPSPQPSSGWLAESSLADQDIDAASGMYKASLGAPSNERSGKAINARKVEGDVGVYHYHDNRAMALQHSYEILVDMIPRVYDTSRITRIKKFDDQEEMININEEIFDVESKEWVKVYDLSQGKYDVAVDVGASYTTQRQMASESMMELVQYAPSIAQKIMPIIAKNLDWPGADEIADVLKDTRPSQEEVQQQIQQAVEQAVEQTKQDMKLQIDQFNADTNRMKVTESAEIDKDKIEVELIKLLDEAGLTDQQVIAKASEMIRQIGEPQGPSTPPEQFQ